MSARVLTGCDECGWRGTPRGYRSRAQADFAFSRHSCERTRRARDAVVRSMARDAAIDRTPKPCLHKVAKHQHGTYVMAKLDGCRCLPCSTATSEYNAARTRAQAYGTWSPYVDARPAAQHLRALSAAGMGWKRAAAAAGVPESSVYPLLYGKPDRNGGKPRTKARRTTVEAILAVPMPTLDDLGETVIVDGTGTRRRLQALITLGWSVQRLAAHRGLDRQALDGALSQRSVQARTARAVRALYDALWDQSPDATTPGEARGITLAKRRAAQMSWAPPLAWDDDTIDDPDALPAHLAEGATDGVDHAAVELAIGGTRVTLTRAERWLAVERLAREGLSDNAIAKRLGVTDRTILRDRQDLGIDSQWSAA